MKLVASAPGKLILFGEHAVVSPYSHLGIATSISDLRTDVELTTKSSKDPFISVDACQIGSEKYTFSWDLFNEIINEYSNFNFEKPIFIPEMVELIENIIGESVNIDVSWRVVFTMCLYVSCLFSNPNQKENYHIKISSQIPIGCGLGSSASLSVSLVTLFLAKLRLNNDFKNRISKSVLKINNRKLISDWSYVLEKIVHGNPSGLDNTICTNGGLISLKEGNFKQITSKSNHKMDLLIVNTNQHRNTKEIIEKVYNKYLEDTTKYSEVFSGIGKCSEEFLKLYKSQIEETEFQERFNELIFKNQMLLEELGVVGHEKFNVIFKIIEKYGLFGKITGAGGGGCCFVNLTKQKKDIEKELIKELEEKGFPCFISNNIGGNGSKIEKICKI